MRNPPQGAPHFSEAELAAMIEAHALPDNWTSMPYQAFLTRRRQLIAGVVRKAFERLRKGEPDTAEVSWPPSAATLEHILSEGETSRVEMKASLRADTAGKGVPPKVLEKVIARTVAGFLNHRGGLLIIGADDHEVPVGLERDFATLGRKDLDGFQQALVQVLATRLGNDVAATVRIHMTTLGPDSRDVALVECRPHPHPVFVDDASVKEFHVRAGNTTRLMDVQEASSYISMHWNSASASDTTWQSGSTNGG
jgi:hypothetical protein